MKITGSNVFLAIEDPSGASRNISGLGNSITLSFEKEEVEVTTFGQSTRERLPGGLNDWELSFDGFYEPDSSGVGKLLWDIFNAGGATLIKLAPNGSSASQPYYAASAKLTGYEISFELEEAVALTATFVARAGSMTRGVF